MSMQRFMHWLFFFFHSVLSNRIWCQMLGLMIFCLCVAACAGGSTEAPAESAPAAEDTAVEGIVVEEIVVEEAADSSQTTVSPVVILVLDSFETSIAIEIDDVRRIDSSRNCLATPDGKINFESDGLGGFKAGGLGLTMDDGTTHGYAVYKEIQELLENMSQGNSIGLPTAYDSATHIASTDGSAMFGIGWMPRIDLYEAFYQIPSGTEQGYIMIVAVDTHGFDTELAADRLQTAIDMLKGNYSIDGISLVGTSGIVINMSFGIVPCDPKEFLGEDVNIVIEKYWQESAAHPGLADFSTTLEQLPRDQDTLNALLYDNNFALLRIATLYEQTEFVGERMASDPIFDLLSDPERSGNNGFIYVAAAGNSGLGFPFAPALWDFVLSTSAPSSVTSNFGEVETDGIYGNWRGTSFAAPRLSVLSAMYLLREEPAECNGLWPPMAYAQSTRTWENKDVATASHDHCCTFLPNNCP